MATKRTPIRRAPRHRITPEAVSVFREMSELEPIRRGCDKGVPNPKCKLAWGDECAQCARERELGDRLFWMLDLRPWNYPFAGLAPVEPPGLSKARRDQWWADQLEAKLDEALSWV